MTAIYTMKAECGTERLHGLAQTHFVGQQRPPALSHDKLNALNLYMYVCVCVCVYIYIYIYMRVVCAGE